MKIKNCSKCGKADITSFHAPRCLAPINARKPVGDGATVRRLKLWLNSVQDEIDFLSGDFSRLYQDERDKSRGDWCWQIITETMTGESQVSGSSFPATWVLRNQSKFGVQRVIGGFEVCIVGSCKFQKS